MMYKTIVMISPETIVPVRESSGFFTSVSLSVGCGVASDTRKAFSGRFLIPPLGNQAAVAHRGARFADVLYARSTYSESTCRRRSACAMSDEDRVIVVGGGPVGTIAALALARAGVPVTIFDALAATAEDHRASTHQPQTLDLLDALELTPRILTQGLREPYFQWRDLIEDARIEFDYGLLAGECAHPYVVQLEQHRTVAAALELATRYPAFDMRRPVRVVEAGQTREYAVAGVEYPDGSRETVRGRYLIGCDGGPSLVRKAMDATFDGFTWPERFNIVTTPFDFATLSFRLRNYCVHPDRWVALFKVPGDDATGLWRCVSPTKEDESDELVQSDAWIAERLAERFPGAGPFPIVHRNMYNVHQRVAGTFRRGRLLIAGDAAHVNNPIGGIGMNSGIHDALNLAAKLIAIWNGADADPLLDRYDRQRRETAVEFVQAQSIANIRMLAERDPAARRRNLSSMRRQAEDPAAAREFVRRGALVSMWERSEAIA